MEKISENKPDNQTAYIINPVPLKPAERKYAFSLSAKECRETGVIGCYVGGFGYGGGAFTMEYTPLCYEEVTKEFADVTAIVLAKLRNEPPVGNGALASRPSMQKFLGDNPDACFLGVPEDFYCFKIDTPEFIYILRFNQFSPDRTYSIYVYHADKLNSVLSQI